MAGEAYQVDYIINLQDNASAGIIKFSSAASKLTKAAENLKKFEATFNQVVAKFDKPLNLSIETATAHKRLDKVLSKIKKIQTEAGKINIGVGGGKNGGSKQPRQPNPTPIPTMPRGNTGRTATRQPASRQPAVPKPRAPRQVTGSDLFGYARINSGGIMGIDMLKGMGLMYGVSAIGSGIGNIIQTSAEYENIMQTAKNILKANYKGGNFNAAFADMEKIAREVGMETKFTAPEVADAVRFLAMAGLPIESIKKAIRPIADIALIGDTELGETADVMTNIMTAYKIKPDDMRKTADIMSRTFTMSNTTLMELAESFKMSGSILQQAGVPFETAAAAFGVLGDAGIKATMAGTTMRTIIANMTKPTKSQRDYWATLGVRRIDEFGNLRDINEIFGDLAKVNNERGTAKLAQEHFKKLEEQYAPQFDALKDAGKVDTKEWFNLEKEYNKASDEIRAMYGGVDVFRLFRMTAASGGGVLMGSIEKWNKIIEENFLSEGLSQKLADAKKNQIIGLWAQLRSAFQEQGLRLFEENDGLIRGYLNRAISFVKSDDFAKILRDVVELLKDVAGLIVRITKLVVGLYQKFAPLVKGYLTFQIIMSGLGKVWTAAKNIKNTFGLIKGVSSTLGLGGGGTAAKVGGASIYGNLLYRSSIPKKYMDKGYQTLLETGDVWQAVKADKDYQKSGFGAVANNRPIYNKYKNYNRRMNAMPVFSAAGGIAGGMLGSAIAPDSEWAGTIAGLAGSLGATALASMTVPGAGWIAAGVIGATAATAAVINHVKAINKAKDAAKAYYDITHKLNTEEWNLSTADDLFLASMRIRSSKLLDEKGRLEAQIELWRRYYKAAAGEPVESDVKSSSYMYDADENFKALIDKMTGEKGGTFRDEQYDLLRANNVPERARAIGEQMFNQFPNNVYGPGVTTDLMRKSVLQKALSEYSDSNTAILTAWDSFVGGNSDLNNTLDIWKKGALEKAGSLQEVQNYVKQFREQYMTPAGPLMSLWDQQGLKADYFKTHSGIPDMLRLPSYYALMMPELERYIRQYEEEATNILTGGNASRDFFNTFARDLFQGEDFKGKFIGDEGFDDIIKGVFNRTFASEVDRNTAVKRKYQEILDEFGKLSPFNQVSLLPILNKTYWESWFPGLDLSDVYGGFYGTADKEGKKRNSYQDVKGVEYDTEKGYFTFGGLPYYGGKTIEPKSVFDLPSVPLVYMFPEQEEPANLNKNGWFSKPAYAAPTVPMWPNGIPVKQENPVPQDSTLMNVAREFTNTSAMLANANVMPWREAVDRISYKAPWEPVTREEVDRATTEPLYAAFAPSYTPFMPPLSQPAASNEAFRPAERQQVAMVARPVVININAERLVDFGTLNIDNATDDEEIAQKVRNALEGILSEVAESTGGNYNYGVSA